MRSDVLGHKARRVPDRATCLKSHSDMAVTHAMWAWEAHLEVTSPPSMLREVLRRVCPLMGTKTNAASGRVRPRLGPSPILAFWLGVACGPAMAALPGPRAPAPSEVAVPAPAAPVLASPNAVESLRLRRLMVPVDGIAIDRVQNTYDAARDGGARQHSAIDILAPRGTPVLAADSGTILRMAFNALGGLTIFQIDPEKHFVYYYAHLDRYAASLRDGSVVSRGDVIGYVGTTGNAPANTPHLHFQVMLYRDRYWEGEALNPFGVFDTAGKRR